MKQHHFQAGHFKMKRNHGVVRRGFTLIELLVVIAIISLLVSILLPSLQKAKDLAKSVVCSTRLRSLGVSTQMYLEQSNGVYPLFTANPNGCMLPHWQLYLLWAMGEADNDELLFRGSDSEKKNREIFHCPSDPNNTCDLANWDTTDYVYICSYGGNSQLGLDNAPNQCCNVAEVREPAKVMLLADCTFAYGRWTINRWETIDFRLIWFSWRHPQNEAFNILFCDGHVENQHEVLETDQLMP